ncbi:hypothetical protein T4A_1415 [Trichinella pseudospiralis]|uniref:Uncharacterized protein n=1 Tax=Trichinella pseudospiralis TaxID=6337 RepID=A0A0V1EMB4_TRIPS|nr:hypothetical protein T4A_1415 [Trichinella pseudospiralis]
MCRKEALRLVPATLSRPLSAHSKCGITEFSKCTFCCQLYFSNSIQFQNLPDFIFTSINMDSVHRKKQLQIKAYRSLRLVPATLSRPLSAHSKCGITEFSKCTFCCQLC